MYIYIIVRLFVYTNFLPGNRVFSQIIRSVYEITGGVMQSSLTNNEIECITTTARHTSSVLGVC